MAYSNVKYNDGEVKFGSLIDLSEDELEMAITVPYQASSSQTPKPRATSTPATVPSNDQVLGAITRLSSGIESPKGGGGVLRGKKDRDDRRKY